MNRVWFGIIAAALAGTPAFADDGAPYDWSGYYAGGHIGYQAGSEDWTLVDNPGDGDSGSLGQVVTSQDVRGFFGGLQVGRNWQDGNRVYGVELDVSWADVNGASDKMVTSGPKAGPREWTTDTDWLATLGPRVGRAYDRTLVYVEGGLALAHADYYHLGARGSTGPERPYYGSATRGGIFVGAGVEQAISENWSAQLEYNFVGTFFGNASLWGNPSEPAVFDISQGAHTVKFSINYHFR